MTKKELIDQLRVAEHNQDVAEESLNQQAENLKDWEPVRHGKWVNNVVYTFSGLDYSGTPQYAQTLIHRCSCCGKCSLTQTDYCPHCPAKMDKGEDDET